MAFMQRTGPAIILTSGGLDSTTCLAIAKAAGHLRSIPCRLTTASAIASSSLPPEGRDPNGGCRASGNENRPAPVRQKLR